MKSDQEKIEEARAALRTAAQEVARARKLLEPLPSPLGAHTLDALGHVVPWLATARREAYYASQRAPDPS